MVKILIGIIIIDTCTVQNYYMNLNSGSIKCIIHVHLLPIVVMATLDPTPFTAITLTVYVALCRTPVNICWVVSGDNISSAISLILSAEFSIDTIYSNKSGTLTPDCYNDTINIET